MTFLFYTRLILYLIAFSIPIVHPAITVPYDSMGWWYWFIIIPGQMFFAFYLFPPRLRLNLKTSLLLSGSFLLIFVLFFAGFTIQALMLFTGGAVVYILTLLIFKTRGRGKIFAIVELFSLAILYYKMLSFSRASESIASESHDLAQILLVVSIYAFLLHCMVLYTAAFQRNVQKKGIKELVVFFSLAVPIVLVIAFLLPINFLEHNIVLNILGEEKKPDLIPLDEWGKGS